MFKKSSFKIIDFLSGTAAIQVNDPQDFKALKDVLKEMGLLGILITKKEENNLQYWRYIASINPHLGLYTGYGPLYFEFHNSKGITFSWGTKQAINWWGEDCIFPAKQVKNDFQKKEIESY